LHGIRWAGIRYGSVKLNRFRRAESRGKVLPEVLKQALVKQASRITTRQPAQAHAGQHQGLENCVCSYGIGNGQAAIKKSVNVAADVVEVAEDVTEPLKDAVRETKETIKDIID